MPSFLFVSSSSLYWAIPVLIFVLITFSIILAPNILWLSWLLSLGFFATIFFGTNFLAPEACIVVAFLFSFEPKWISRTPSKQQEYIFYDGECGLCHRWVTFVLSEENQQVSANKPFIFAPLQSDFFRDSVNELENIPDSIIVKTDGNEILVKSKAVFHIMQRLGGFWRVLASVLTLIPVFVRDFGYDLVARVRKRVFATPKEICPIMPVELRARFKH